jgi:protein TonB
VPDNLNLPDDFVVFDNSTVHENSIFMIPVQESPEAPVEEPFVNPEFPPDFQGEGIEGFWKWVQQHIAYPREAIGLNLQGTVYIEFIVNKEGQVSHARVVKGVDSLLDTEVLRVVRSSPRWTPGMQGINKVNVKFTIPVTFLLK